MALGDGFAPIIGKSIKSKKIYGDKTLAGTLTVIIISIIVLVVFDKIFGINYKIYEIIVISIWSGLLEVLGKKGLDNLSLPLGIALISWWFGVI